MVVVKASTSNVSLNLNYFEIFGIEIQITIDLENLNKKYLTLQAEFHPDKFVNASNLEKVWQQEYLHI